MGHDHFIFRESRPDRRVRMNDLLYYEPLADVLEADATYRNASAQVKFGFLTLAASFHWNLLKLLGDRSPLRNHGMNCYNFHSAMGGRMSDLGRSPIPSLQVH